MSGVADPDFEVFGQHLEPDDELFRGRASFVVGGAVAEDVPAEIGQGRRRRSAAGAR